MNVLMLSKACVVGMYQRKLEEIAARGVELTVVVPPYWRTGDRSQPLERAHTRGYRLVVAPARFNGHFHLHYYPALKRILEETRPQIVHVDEEPWDFVTFRAVRAAVQVRARPLFFTWQNLQRTYPPPFTWFARYAFRHCAHAIAGNADAVGVLRAKGYDRAVAVIPQFGVDPDVSRPSGENKVGSCPFTLGYGGRLVREKGVDILLRAAARLEGNWRVRIAGDGPEREPLQALAQSLGIAERVAFLGNVPSAQTPALFARFDTLVLPSRRMPNWIEQFGRVLIEAMACAVPVVGSDCGEIPNVIGDAGLVFPQEDVDALRAHLARLQGDASLRAGLGARGRERVLAHFTQASVAERTVAVYREMLQDAPP